jgi:hypothetical protein
MEVLKLRIVGNHNLKCKKTILPGMAKEVFPVDDETPVALV